MDQIEVPKLITLIAKDLGNYISNQSIVKIY